MNWDARSNPDAREHRERRPRARKNTRRWCKGIEGREHQPEVVFDRRHRMPCGPAPEWARRLRGGREWWCWHIVRCAVCGKHLRTLLSASACPDFPKVESQ